MADALTLGMVADLASAGALAAVGPAEAGEVYDGVYRNGLEAVARLDDELRARGEFDLLALLEVVQRCIESQARCYRSEVDMRRRLGDGLSVIAETLAPPAGHPVSG